MVKTCVYILSGDLYILIGTIPAGLGNLPLIVLQVAQNLLSGTIPNTLCNLYKTATRLSMQVNNLEGTLPNCFKNFTLLQYLDVNDNMLSGVLPASIVSLSKLIVLYVKSNKFKGSIDMFHDMKEWPYCTRFDLSENKLLGNLNYSNVFTRLSNVRTIDLSSNCLSGSLPSSICSLSQLNSLSLNGLSSKCGKQFNPLGLFKAPFYKNSIGGMLPCIWEMPSLKNLFLSGNLMTGSLSSVRFPNSSLLRSVSLTSNYFTGELSQDLRTRWFHDLDLRYLYNLFILIKIT